MNDPVQRSAPVRIIMHSPYGKTRALMVRIKPGAFSWNHGVALVLSTVPQAKASRQPADTALKKTLSSRMLPFCTPALETASMTSPGENASRAMSDLIMPRNRRDFEGQQIKSGYNRDKIQMTIAGRETWPEFNILAWLLRVISNHPFDFRGWRSHALPLGQDKALLRDCQL